MFAIRPDLLLAGLGALTGAAALAAGVARRRRRRALRQLALEWGMTYSAHDRLRVTPKVVAGLTVPGAADVCVFDLIYGSDGQQAYRYVFTAEYTVGVVRGKHRRTRVGTFREPRCANDDAATQAAEPPAPAVLLAPEDLPLIDQYRRLAPSARARP